MKARRKRWVAAIVALVVIAGISLLLGHIQRGGSRPHLYVKYHYTAEATYQDIEISRSELIYTYFPKEIAKEKCANWIKQSPCWTEEDLRTSQVSLSEDEIDDLVSLIRKTGFMDLESTYGGADESQRYYAHGITVKIGEKEKAVVYQSCPDASPMPDAFEKLMDKLFELVSKRFNTRL